MEIYKNIYSGDNLPLAESRNFLDIIRKLEEAKKNKNFFVLVSSDIVFDRELDLTYTELSKPNSKKIASKLLAEAERKVIEYDDGIVVRKQDILSDFIPFFDEIRSGEDRFLVPNLDLYLLDDSIYDIIFNYVHIFSKEKIIHICSNHPYSLPFVLHMVAPEKQFDIDLGKKNFKSLTHKGKLESKVLKEMNGFQELMKRNKIAVDNKLINYGS